MEILDSKLRHEKKKPTRLESKKYNSYFSNMIGFVKNSKEFKSHKNKYANSACSLPRTVYKNQFYFYILGTNNFKIK